jgi:hypothetical protein
MRSDDRFATAAITLELRSKTFGDQRPAEYCFLTQEALRGFGTKQMVWRSRKSVMLTKGVGVVIGPCRYFAALFLAALVAGRSWGGAAGAATEWLPRIQRSIRRRRNATEPLSD